MEGTWSGKEREKGDVVGESEKEGERVCVRERVSGRYEPCACMRVSERARERKRERDRREKRDRANE